MFTLDLNKISDSRVFFLAAMMSDTVCTGSLAIMFCDPSRFEAWSVTKTLLVAVSITLPIIVFGAFIVFTALSEKIPVDERARRSLMVACVIHGFFQVCLAASFLVYGKHLSIPTYVKVSATPVIFVSLGLVAASYFSTRASVNALKAARRRRQVARSKQ